MSSPVTDRPASKILDLEVKDARIIFTPSWDGLQEEVGRENLRFPKEIILLGGAPGAGKGTQTEFINETRGLTCPAIVISELLTTPEMEKLKAQGVMVGDKEVVSLLLRTLLDPIYRDGVVLDGFPRTPVQVECLKLLFDEMIADGRMPKPKRINARTVWDREQLDCAFAALPNEDGEGALDSWSDF